MGTPNKTVAFETLGCKLNFTEASTIARDFRSHGYAQVDSNDAADIYVINTCSVTENANKKARKAVRRALRKSPNAKIVVIGCYAQLNPDEISKIPGVSIVVGAEDKFNIISLIRTNNLNDDPIIINSNIHTIDKFVPSYSIGERTRSFLKIQDGCNYSCSFCTIPLARGNSRSSNIQEILALANKLAETQVREIVLTGVNVGDFGNYNENLFDLIEKLDEVKGIDRYRISSIEPNLLTDEIINFIAKSKKFLPHFHIPLQSGSDEILKSMKRRYRSKLYADKIHKVKSIIPQACIGVDVIVGFPGESDNNFQQTYDFLNDIDISYLHIFSYSLRDNTYAANIKNKIQKDIISARSKILHRLSLLKKRYFYDQNIGSMRDILIENFENNILYGHSENYIPVRMSGKCNEVNEIIPVKLIQSKNGKMYGERED